MILRYTYLFFSSRFHQDFRGWSFCVSRSSGVLSHVSREAFPGHMVAQAFLKCLRGHPGAFGRSLPGAVHMVTFLLAPLYCYAVCRYKNAFKIRFSKPC